MRILFLSNFYPPLRAGGYAQLCYEVAQGLQALGHTIGVLTSNYKQEQAPVEEPRVYRLLHLEGDLFYYQPLDFFISWHKHQQENQVNLMQVVDRFNPDILVIWSLWALPKTVAALAGRLLPDRVVYYLAGHWPVVEDMHSRYWHGPARHWFMRLPKRLLGAITLTRLARESRPTLKFEHVLCVSAALRDILIEQGLPLQHALVVHNGIDVEQFQCKSRLELFEPEDRRLKLLYAGQLAHQKGVHTAVEAIAKLAHRPGMDQVSLMVLGRGHPGYEASLHTMVEKMNLGDYVTFHKPVSRDQMPALLRQFDVLVFPSIYEEPLARMTQEAMASGLVVVGTTTGGTKEILVDGQNGLTFAPENAEDLSEKIARLVTDPDLRCRLAKAGRQTVVEKFSIDRTVKEIEAYLQTVVNGAVRSTACVGQL
jgi:glycogen(starch) synthase